MERLGVMGGTFDPIHVGHVLLALWARERLPLDRVLFVPAADPPHKETRPDMAPAADRWVMVERAIAGFPGFAASRLELDRPGKSYTVETLRTLRTEYPDSRLYLVIGEDNVAQLPSWHDPRTILELCTVVAGTRASAGLAGDTELARQVILLGSPVFEVSSTEVRRRLAAGKPVRYLVPDAVLDYIAARGLYGCKGSLDAG
ncbi:MAG: nicotinate-nucleotide adenylyltransferase [Candidatus Latescibacterota bacterium]|jgi:nicotinate-nucleotide adenylyltransferase